MRSYWLVNEDSPVMPVIRETQVKQKVFRDACKALAARYPGSKVWTWDNCQVVGIEFAGEIPDGWRATKKTYAVPNAKTKLGRELRRDIIEHGPVGPCSRTFSSALTAATGLSFTHYGDCQIFWTTLEQFGDLFVLGVPAGASVPPGCRELKMSEYWGIKEAADDPQG